MISDHILGLRLKHLTQEGLIRKKASGEEAVYEVSDAGRALVEILHALALWQKGR